MKLNYIKKNYKFRKLTEKILQNSENLNVIYQKIKIYLKKSKNNQNSFNLWLFKNNHQKHLKIELIFKFKSSNLPFRCTLIQIIPLYSHITLTQLILTRFSRFTPAFNSFPHEFSSQLFWQSDKNIKYWHEVLLSVYNISHFPIFSRQACKINLRV